MKKLILLFVLMLSASAIQAQELYVKTFGNATAKPILFLHGGPGYNAAGFEVSAAQQLADQGFFVIVYDRRGEGRSVDANAKFDFTQTFDDINGLLKKYNISKATLMGHSFGGIIATLYAEKYPEKVNAIILVSAPVALQESFKTIQNSARKIYTEKDDKESLKYLDMLGKMDPSSMEYASYTFMHAMQNGFYSPKKPTAEAGAIYKSIAADPDFKYMKEMTREAPMGFWKNENYTTIDLTKNLENLVAKKVKIFGIYGKEDGLYSAAQISQLEKIIGKDNLHYFENASHNVFIDQQQLFLQAVKSDLK
ncbi:MAG TPA: alpha/beta hydrolase [Flavobacterium sp.]|nr:alpha/beta hydrolase [Flavobacterium sp.]